MAEYRYVALDRSGRESSGSVTCSSRAEALQKLELGGLYPLEVAEGREKAGSTSGPAERRGGRVSRREVVMFVRQLGDLLCAGFPMDRALLVLVEQSESASMGKVIGGIRDEVQAGKQLSEALEVRRSVFPDLVARMVRAGEAGGQLDSVLDSAGRYLEADLNRRAQVTGALVYPCLLLVVSLVSVAFIVTFLIPRLTAVFEDMGQVLPLPTVILLAVSAVVTKWWYLILACVVGLVLVFTSWRRTARGALALDKLTLRLPVVGPVAKALAMSRFSRTLAALHKGGVTILDALDLVAESMGNRVYEKALRDVKEGVREGEMIGSRLADTGIFPPMAVHMVTVGEESGNLDGLLSRLADIYDFEADNRLKRAMSLVEPGIILVMGVFIAFIIMAVLLPIFDLNSGVGVN